MRRFTEVSAPLEERLAASALARVADVTLALLRVRRERRTRKGPWPPSEAAPP